MPSSFLRLLADVHHIATARQRKHGGRGVRLWDWSRAIAWRRVCETMHAVGDYSETHPVVAIGILKGQKETKLTGEQVGEALSNVLMQSYDGIPSKVFIAAGTIQP